MTQLVDRHAIINNHRVAYGVHGTGEPVVFVHGTPSTSYIWRNVVPEVVAAGYQAFVFDLLGYGMSERPWDPSVDTSMTGNEAVLNELVDLWAWIPSIWWRTTLVEASHSGSACIRRIVCAR